MDLGVSLQILVIVVIAFLVITAWDEVIDRLIIQYLGWSRESIWTWLFIAVLFTVILLAILSRSKIELHEVFGVPENVDVELTGQVEVPIGRQIIHIPAE